VADGRLVLSGFSAGYRDGSGEVRQVTADVDLELVAGRILGLVGESGCGKSTTGLSLMGSPAGAAVRLSGSVEIDGTDLYGLPASMARRLWGRRLAYVSQGAGTALNPLRSIGFQLEEPLRRHLGLPRAEARTRAMELLERVGIPDPKRAMQRYPHQFSGGQQQRLGLAITTACRPEILILDEPTSALDVTTQREVNALIVQLVQEGGAAALYISHDLAMLATLCDELIVMYAGEIVERGAAADVIAAPRHPYTAALVDAVPSVGDEELPVGIPGLPPSEVVVDRCAYSDRCRFAVDRCLEGQPPLEQIEHDRLVRCIRARELGPISSERLRRARSHATVESAPLLELTELECRYGETVAVEEVSMTLATGEKVGIVGESGSGKSTLLRAIAGLHAQSSGTMTFEGTSLPASIHRRPRALRQAIQLVFQSADTSLNPRHSVETILTRPLVLFRSDVAANQRRNAVADLLAQVRLDTRVLGRRPHELSGGQRQRVALARAFAARPKLLLCDEVVSALDVSVAASVMELLLQLVEDTETTMVFVTHNLALVSSITDRIAVMKDGLIVEEGPTAGVIGEPKHVYTRELLAAA
jgi:peptide/nickel transport system ATP-binding protein